MRIKKRKGSVLVFALIVLSIVLSSALSITAVNVINRKSAASTSQSVRSFQVADSGMEMVLKQVYRDGDAYVDLDAMAVIIDGILPGDPVSCSDGAINLPEIAGGSARVTFFDTVTDAPFACDDTDWRKDLQKIKSEGSSASGTTRVVESVVSPCNSMVTYGNPDLDAPQGILFEPKSSSVWVANSGADTVSKIDATTGLQTALYVVGTSPIALAYDSTLGSEAVWVLKTGTPGSVSKINIGTGTISGPYSVGSNAPVGIAFVPELFNPPASGGNSMKDAAIWVTDGISHTVTVLEAATGGVSAGSPIAIGGSSEATGIAVELQYTAANKAHFQDTKVWVVNSAQDRLVEISARNRNIDETYSSGLSGHNPYGIAYDPVTTSMWITNLATESVMKIDAADGDIQGVYPGNTDTSLGGIAFDSLGNTVWTTASPMSRLNTSDASLRKSYTTRDPSTGNLLSHGTGIAFDNITNSVWISNPNENKVTRIWVCK